MRMPLVALCLAVALLAGCAGGVHRADIGSPNLAGSWTFQVQTGSNVTHGAMTLAAQGQGYSGTLTTDQGNNVLPVRSLTLDGSDMDMIVESPNGNVIFAGTLSRDARSFLGTVTYHNGQTFPMSGSR